MSNVGFDGGFLFSRDGMFKILQFILSLLIVIIVAATNYAQYINLQELHFVVSTTGIALLFLLASLIIYFFKLYSVSLLKKLPWKMVEIVFNITLAVIFFISMAISASAASKTATADRNLPNSYIASAILCTVVLLASAIYTFLIIRSGVVRSQGTSASRAATVNT